MNNNLTIRPVYYPDDLKINYIECTLKAQNQEEQNQDKYFCFYKSNENILKEIFDDLDQDERIKFLTDFTISNFLKTPPKRTESNLDNVFIITIISFNIFVTFFSFPYALSFPQVNRQVKLLIFPAISVVTLIFFTCCLVIDNKNKQNEKFKNFEFEINAITEDLSGKFKNLTTSDIQDQLRTLRNNLEISYTQEVSTKHPSIFNEESKASKIAGKIRIVDSLQKIAKIN